MEIPADFLKAEVRSGYLVEEKAKRLWAVELDLLQRFMEVCDQYKLSWFALGGTLLGAVRHGGFIPWDDDIDIIMPRKDYDLLLQVGPAAFQYPYFFQCTLTEDKFWRTHVQLRNTSTTGCIRTDAKKNINRGVFIDIMVLDEVPDSVGLRALHRRRIWLCRWLRYVDRLRINKSPVCRLVGSALADALGNRYYRRCFRRVNRICAGYRGCGSDKVAHTTLSYRECLVWDADDFSETLRMDFEFLKINVPVGYRHILAKHYGDDYMKLPERQPDSAHGALIVDTSVPYTAYFGQGWTGGDRSESMTRKGAANDHRLYDRRL